MTFSPDQIVTYGLSALLLNNLINTNKPEYYHNSSGTYTTYWGDHKNYNYYSAEYASYIGPQSLDASQWNAYTQDEQGSYASETYDSGWFQENSLDNYYSNAPTSSTSYQLSTNGTASGVGKSLESDNVYYALTYSVDTDGATVTTPVQSNSAQSPSGSAVETVTNNGDATQVVTFAVSTTYTDTTSASLSGGITAGITIGLGTSQTAGAEAAKVTFHESLTAALSASMSATTSTTQTQTNSFTNTQPITVGPGETWTAQLVYTIGNVTNYWSAPGTLSATQGNTVVTTYEASNYDYASAYSMSYALQEAINYGIPLSTSIDPSTGEITSGGTIQMGTGFDSTVIYYQDTTSTTSTTSTSSRLQSSLSSAKSYALLQSPSSDTNQESEKQIDITALITSLKRRSEVAGNASLIGTKITDRLNKLVESSKRNPANAPTFQTEIDGRTQTISAGYRLTKGKGKENNMTDNADYVINSRKRNLITTHLHGGIDFYYGNDSAENVTANLTGGSKRLETGAGKDVVFLSDLLIERNSLADVNLGSDNDVYFQRSSDSQVPSQHFVNRLTLGKGKDIVLVESTAMLEVTDFQLGIDKLEWDKDYQVSIEGDATLLSANDGNSKIYLRGAISSLLTRGDESIQQLARLNPGIFSTTYGVNQNDLLSLSKALSLYGLTNTINTSWKQIQNSNSQSSNYIEALAFASGVTLDKSLVKSLNSALRNSHTPNDFIQQFGELTNSPKPDWALNTELLNSNQASPIPLQKDSSLIGSPMNASLIAASNPYNFYDGVSLTPSSLTTTGNSQENDFVPTL